MGLTKPTNAPANTNDLAALLKCKMHAFVALGEIDADEIPTTAAELDALFGGATPTFLTLGDLAKDPIDIKFSYAEEEVHAGKIPGVLSVDTTVKSLALHTDMIDFLDSDEAKGVMTLLFVPFRNPAAADVTATNPSKAVIVTNAMLIPDGALNGNNKYPEVNLKFYSEPNKISDVVIMLNLTS